MQTEKAKSSHFDNERRQKLGKEKIHVWFCIGTCRMQKEERTGIALDGTLTLTMNR